MIFILHYAVNTFDNSFLGKIFFSLFFGHTADAYGILVPWLGIEPMPAAVEAREASNLTTGLPGKSWEDFLWISFVLLCSI